MNLTMDLFARANDALKINPVTGVDESLAVHGSDWLWAVTATYATALKPSGYSITSSPSFFSSVPSPISPKQQTLAGVQLYRLTISATEVVRQMFWVKYVNWVVAWPSLALCLGLISGVSWTTMLCNIAIALQWPVCYLVGAFVTTSYKWGFFAFGTFGWLILAMSTINESREAAQLLGVDKDYIILSVWLNLLWLLYPIGWSLSDGGNKIGVTGTSVFFGVLDVLMVPGLTFLVLFLFPQVGLPQSEHCLQ
ncbi:uncharacterized protein N7477_005049 [Penicillium maclennaniae]|uniref:uncharacterized protein n=1 Tax=Penicillium maclennaniae TaxID=1343394 RepID=UPI00253FED4D|nr:uncharacterized protein N7477_005049 [Penicillium maclennaniae]KAJ5675115.1 hypothetical protein N7477_005049 [Penicillium maclennaniae]